MLDQDGINTPAGRYQQFNLNLIKFSRKSYPPDRIIKKQQKEAANIIQMIFIETRRRPHDSSIEYLVYKKKSSSFARQKRF